MAWSTEFNRSLLGSLIVVNGVAYVGSQNGYLEAVNVSTGTPLPPSAWTLPYLGNTSYSQCGAPNFIGIRNDGVIATPTYAGGRLVEAGGNTSFYVLSTNGTVLQRVDIGNASTARPWYDDYNWASPLVYGGFAYQGTAALCEYDRGLGSGNWRYMQGQLLQINLTNGTIAHVFNVTKGLSPADEGGSIWTSASVDPSTNLVWLTTGNENQSSQTPANCEYPRSIVALNATTLAYVGAYQVGSVGTDNDFGAGPTLFHDRLGHAYVGAINKDGTFYAVNATPAAGVGCSSVLNLAWSKTFGIAGPPGPISPAAFDGTHLYVAGGGMGNGSGVVEQLQPNNGSLVWSHALYTPYPEAVHAGLVVANGLVYVAAANNSNGGGSGPGGELQILDAATGNLLFHHIFNQSVSAAVVVAEGRVFVATGAENNSGVGYLDAFALPSAAPWVNGSASEGPAPAPPGAWGASLAYDTADREYVSFGGCAVSACPSNQTWTFRAGIWTNVTNASSPPPARDRAAMTYDPTLGAVLLYGGCGRTVCPWNDTWEFVGGAWTNVTSTGCTGPPSCPPALYSATLTSVQFSIPHPLAPNGSVLFGGCEDRNCSLRGSGTYEFVPPSGWTRLVPTASPPARAGAQAAFDPTLGSIVLFGGEVGCGSVACDSNATWLFGASGTWANDTASLRGGPVPSARDNAAMFDDPTFAAVRLFGGWNLSAAAPRNDSWRFGCTSGSCGWAHLAESTSPSARGWAAAAASDGSVDSLLLGGTVAAASGTPDGDWWELGQPVRLNESVPVLSVPAGNPLTLSGQASGGAAPYPEYGWNFPNGSTSFRPRPNLTTLAGGAGTVDGTAFVSDSAWTVGGTAFQFSVVSDLRVNVTVTPTPAEVDRSLRMDAAVPAGTAGAPFALSWNFGDGATAVGPSVTHSFAAPGSFRVTATVADSLGDQFASVVPVSVAPAPSLTVTANRTALDLSEAVAFLAETAGGVGPFVVNWSFGDGTYANDTSSVNHTFSSVGPSHVVATVTDARGGAGAASLSVTVNLPLAAYASVSPGVAIPLGTPAQFFGTTFGGTPGPAGDAFAWSFLIPYGGSLNASGPNVTEEFATTGLILVLLNVTDATGATSTTNLTIESTGGVDHGGPVQCSCGESSPSWEWEAVLAGVVAVSIGAAVWYYRRRGKDPPL